MSGGIAYVYDPLGDFNLRCNLVTVDLEPVENSDDIAELLDLIEQHRDYTGSTVAQAILDDWPAVMEKFVKVMPIDYKRVLAERARHDEEIEATVHGVGGK
jgi:glutamate synthase domain-containing protein 3